MSSRRDWRGYSAHRKTRSASGGHRISQRTAGADLSHIAKTTTYVTSMSEFRTPEILALRTRRFHGRAPANTLVEVARLADPAYKVEIEAIAVLP